MEFVFRSSGVAAICGIKNLGRISFNLWLNTKLYMNMVRLHDTKYKASVSQRKSHILEISQFQSARMDRYNALGFELGHEED